MCINPGRFVGCVAVIWPKNRQRGVTLIELIVFIIIVSVGVIGLISVTGSLTRFSSDPMIRKQMIAVAETLLNEVLHQPFTYCDPDDANAAKATSTAGCAVDVQDNGGALAPVGKILTGPMPAGETRPVYDNVADYGTFSQAAASDVTGGNAMAGYGVAVAVVRAGDVFGIADDAALRVTVTVTHAGQDDFSLTGYRFRYAPRI